MPTNDTVLMPIAIRHFRCLWRNTFEGGTAEGELIEQATNSLPFIASYAVRRAAPLANFDSFLLMV